MYYNNCVTEMESIPVVWEAMQDVLHDILDEYSAANRYPRLCVEVLNIFFYILYGRV